jgi:Fe-S-cluster containining protein
MRELDQRLLRRAVQAVRQGTPPYTWSTFADLIVAERRGREGHLDAASGALDRSLAGDLDRLLAAGLAVHPLRLDADKVADIRRYLEGLPVYSGFHIFSSDQRQRPLAEVRRESTLAGYTADQLVRAPHLVDFLNTPAIVDFMQLALGCVPTLYSVNAWWSFPAQAPNGLSSQFFHRDNDDWRFFTLFLYLTDVDDGAGPHQIIAGSHTIAGMQQLADRVRARNPAAAPIAPLDSFRTYAGAEFSARCEQALRDAIVDVTGPAGTIFTANTIAIHRGLMPTRTPRLVVWARFGLGPNGNSVDLEHGPLALRQVPTRLADTPRNRYVNRLLFEFDRGPEPVYAPPEQIPARPEPAPVPPSPVSAVADGPLATTTVRLTLGELKVEHPITVPQRAVPAARILPTLQGLVNAVVDAAEAGQAISCRKGCGACCRQLVPISRTEGEALLALVEAMPEPRRLAVQARFAEAEARIAAAGLAERNGRSHRELSAAYFALGVPCPFLEEESCSIHPDRPLVCREYLVTSPAALCSGPAHDGVTPVPVPKLSLAARRLQDDGDDWFPLAMLMAWNRKPRAPAAARPGTEWAQRFLKGLSK